jgi:ABC-2 type transport system permease protein
MRGIKLILISYGTYLKSMVEYRPAFVMDILVPIVIYLMAYLGIWIMLDKFKMIQGWTLYEVMLLFNFNLFTYALASFIFRIAFFQEIQEMVRMGNFDIALVRPVNSFVYVLMGRPHAGYFGQMSLATVIFILCFSNLDIEFTPIKILFFIAAIIGGTLIQSSLWIFGGTLSFWIVLTNTISGTLLGSCRDFIDYPISIYSKFVQVMLTFILPLAFINFFPASYLLDKSGETLFHPALQYGTPIAGIVMFALAYGFWTIGVNKYESTGS